MLVIDIAIVLAGLWVYSRVPEPEGQVWRITREGEMLSYNNEEN